MDKKEEIEKKQQTKQQISDIEKQLRETTRKNLELAEENELLKKVIGIFSQLPQ